MQKEEKIEVEKYQSSSEYANKVLKKSKHSFQSYIRDIMKSPLWMPSIYTGIKAWLIFFGLLAILKVGIWYGQEFVVENNILIIKNASSLHQTLIAVNTGIGAVLIGLAFFVAQSFLDKDDSDKARVLLKTSSFFALLMAEIGAFILLLSGDINILGCAVVVGVGLITLIYVGKTVRILISSSELESNKIKMYTDVLNEKIFKKIEEYFHIHNQNEFISEYWNKIDEDYNELVKFEVFGPTEKALYNAYSLDLDGGVICDIKINVLSELIENRYREYLSIHQGELKPKDGEVGNWQEAAHSDESKKPFMIITGYPGKGINTETPLIYIQKDVRRAHNDIKEDHRFISQKELSKIFIWTSKKETDDQIRHELIGLKKRCRNSIKNNDVEYLSIHIGVYLSIVEEFFRLLNQYNARFSYKDAKITRNALFTDRLTVFDWINEDMWEIIESVRHVKEERVVRVLTYLPIQFLKVAVKNNDHFIFQIFVRYYTGIYKHSFHDEINMEIRDVLVEESWMRLKKFNQYTLLGYFRNNKIDNFDMLGYAKTIILEYQELLKMAFDKKSEESFKRFLRTLNELYPSGFYYGKSDEYSEIKDDLKKYKILSFFGVSSWMLGEILEGDHMGVEFLNEMLEYIPKKIVTISEIYTEANDFNIQNEWKWDRWELNKHDEGVVYSPSLSENINKLFAICMLKILSKAPNEIDSIKLPMNDKLVFASSKNGELRKTIENMKVEVEERKYDKILDEKDCNQFDPFDKLLEDLCERFDESQRELKRTLRISEVKIKDFQNLVKKNFSSTPGMRSFLFQYDLIDFKVKVEDLKKGLNSFGIAVINNKDAFLDEADGLQKIHYLDFGEGFGRSLIQGENRKIGELIEKHSKVVDLNDIEQIIRSFERPVIFGNVLGVDAFGRSVCEKYVPEWARDFKQEYKVNGVAGIYNSAAGEVLVYSMFDVFEQESICIVDLKKFGRIIQYTPYDDKSIDQDNILLIKVDELRKGTKRFESLLKEQPEWLKELKSEEKKSEYLQENVLIDVFEKFEFVLNDEFEGVRVVFENDEL